jgi:hypothetical protein
MLLRLTASAFCERKANLVLIPEVGIEPAAKRQCAIRWVQ